MTPDPNSDDAFMFYGLSTNTVRVPGYAFHHTLTDIETLNRTLTGDGSEPEFSDALRCFR